MRTSDANAFENFGNPFSEAGYGGTIKVPSIGEAVIAYKEWLLGTNHKDVKPEQRTWILNQINQGKLDGVTLLYAGKSEARGQGMHPTALAEVVEQLRTSQSSTSVKSVDSEKSSTIATDIEVFNKLVSDNNGELPASFMVDGVRLWKIYKNGNYNLVDEETGEIYMRNVNMETGKAETEPELTELITDELRQTAMDELLNLLELPGIVQAFADLNEDVNDILNNLANAKTREDYNKVMKIIDKLC